MRSARTDTLSLWASCECFHWPYRIYENFNASVGECICESPKDCGREARFGIMNACVCLPAFSRPGYAPTGDHIL